AGGLGCSHSRHRCTGRGSVGKLRQAAPGGERFGPSHSRPWRAIRPPRQYSGPGTGGCPSCAHPGTGGNSVGMTSASRSVTVLGSTGSVGTQTVELLMASPERFQVCALVAGRNANLLAEQAVALRADRAVIADPAQYAALRQALAGTGIDTAAG